MFVRLLSFLFISVFLLNFIPAVSAQSPVDQTQKPTENYYRALVLNVIKTDFQTFEDTQSFTQELKVKILEGPNKEKEVEAINTGSSKFSDQKLLKEGDQIILLETIQKNKKLYTVWEKYRLNYLIYLVIGFFSIIILFAGLKGFGSILGMITSFIIIIGFIVPQILNGKDPIFITVIGSCAILLITIFLAHGLSKKTGVAVISTFLALGTTGILAYIFVELIGLSGLSDENSYMLQIGGFNISAKGLLLGGIIIGSLGVLDDVTTTQSSAIFEIYKLNRKLSITDIFYRGYNIGKDHIASVVNTLILAYAGASLGLFVIFVINPNNMPTWVILNSELVVVEIVRAIVGSIGLILAVPITTLLASIIVKKTNP